MFQECGPAMACATNFRRCDTIELHESQFC
jgi:hypothetical protein